MKKYFMVGFAFAVFAFFACSLVVARSVEAREPGWRTYENERFGYEVDYPEELTRVRKSDNGDGVELSSEDGDLFLTVWGSYNALNETIEEIKERSVASGKEAGWKMIRGSDAMTHDFYSLTYDAGEHLVYEQYLMEDDTIMGLQFSYPKEDEKEFEAVVRRIADSAEID